MWFWKWGTSTKQRWMNTMKVNGTHVHAVFQVCCMGSILLLLISISSIIHLTNFSNVQKLPSYFHNIQSDDIWYVKGSLCMTGGRLNGSYLTRVRTSLSITCCCQVQQGLPSFFINFTSIILKLAFLLFSFLDFPGPAALPDYLHVEAFTKSCFGR